MLPGVILSLFIDLNEFRAEYCSCQGPSNGQKNPLDNEADRNPLTSGGPDTAKKSPLTNPEPCLEPQGAVWTFFSHRSEESEDEECTDL